MNFDEWMRREGLPRKGLYGSELTEAAQEGWEAAMKNLMPLLVGLREVIDAVITDAETAV